MRMNAKPETWEEFLPRATQALLDANTRIYFDTSFLMWLTRVGRRSRKELFDWLSANCAGRVHVPAWAAHEYLTHHVAATISVELEAKVKELSGLARTTYAFLRPFLDDPIADGSTDAQPQQLSVRAALQALDAAAEVAKKWKSHYPEHAGEVMAFVTDHVSAETSIFSEIPGIKELGLDRFDSRVPPGFQDRRKSERQADDDLESWIGNNRWGDLLFWKEILAHAKGAQAQHIIILSRDCKNDWHLGGRTAPDDESLLRLKSGWRPIPMPHPMLELEAKITSKIDRVVLLDSVYLAAVLRETAGDSVKSFVDVAIVPDPPNAANVRKEAVKDEVAKRNQRDADKASALGVLFLDGPGVGLTLAAFKAAAIRCKTAPAAGSVEQLFIERANIAISSGNSITSVIDKDSFKGFDNSMLACVGRMLHDAALAQSPGFGEAMADLLGILGGLPEGTAGSLYLGLLTSMFMPGSRQARLPPSSPVASQIFLVQDTPFAQMPIAALASKLDGLDERPLYRPDAAKPAINIVLDIEPDSNGQTLLGSINVAGEELFHPAQIDPALNLRAMLNGVQIASGAEIVRIACELFALPFTQVLRTNDFSRDFGIAETAGFKAPSSVYK